MISENETETSDDESPGWDAITDALSGIYGDQEPVHFGTILPAMLGGDDPLQGISVYRRDEADRQYHYVTYGFSELYEKESSDPEVSGFGFELTIVLDAEDDVTDPPMWPLSLLQNLARYVFSSGNAFDENHHLPCNGPIALEAGTDMTCLAFLLDPLLGEIETPNGNVKFLRMVAMTDDEYELAQNGYFDAIRDRVVNRDPGMVTRLSRKSILLEDGVREEIEVEPPTSRQRESFGTNLEFEDVNGQFRLTIGATRVDQMVQMMQTELGDESPIVMFGEQTGFAMILDESNRWETDEEGFIWLRLTAAAAEEIAARLEPVRGTHTFDSFPELTIEIVPVEIKDRDGNVTSVVG